MSVEITPNAATAATPVQPPPPPSLDITVFPHALGITTAGGAKSYMIPFKVIEMMHLERRGGSAAPADAGVSWVLTIQTARQTINMASGRNIEAEFRAACMAYNMG
jgi:hypothetical protein